MVSKIVLSSIRSICGGFTGQDVSYQSMAEILHYNFSSTDVLVGDFLWWFTDQSQSDWNVLRTIPSPCLMSGLIVFPVLSSYAVKMLKSGPAGGGGRIRENEQPNASPTRQLEHGDSSPSVIRPETQTDSVTTSQHVLPRAVPRHEVAPGPQPEDVQHAVHVLASVLG